MSNGVVYVGSEDDNVYALNASTGALIWKYATGGMIMVSSPAVADGRVYIGSNDYNVYSLNASNGALIWKYTTGGYVVSSPAVSNGVVYVGSYDDKIYALNAANRVARLELCHRRQCSLVACHSRGHSLCWFSG